MWNLGRSLIPSFRGDYTTLTNFPVELKSALLAIGVPLICSASTRFPQLPDRNYTWLNYLISEAQHAAGVAIGQGKKVYNFTSSKIGNIIFKYEGTSRMAAQLMAICDKPSVSVEAQDMVDEKENPHSSESSLAMATGHGLNTTARLLNSLFPERIEKKTLYTILEPHLIEIKCSKLMNLTLRGCAFDEADFEDLTVIRSSLLNLQIKIKWK